MASVSVTYRPPKGESRVCEVFGFTFFDGQPVEIEDTPENKPAIAKLSKNPVFEVSENATAHEVAVSQPDPDDYPPEDQPRSRSRRRG